MKSFDSANVQKKKYSVVSEIGSFCFLQKPKNLFFNILRSS
jgi:hypothetical protein